MSAEETIVARYGLRLNLTQLAALLDVEKKTLYNKISAGTCPVRTYVDNGKRFADSRDVAEHFDKMRSMAA